MGYKINKIYVGDKQVWPKGGGGWQPGANTVAYYKFEDNLNDSSGNGHTASMVAGTMGYTTGKVGQGYSSTTSNGITTGISSSFFGSAFTVMFWIKFNSVSSVMRLCGGYSTSSTSSQYADRANIQYESGQGGLQFYNYSGQRTSWTRTPTAGTWYHVAIVGGGTANDLVAYINGTQASRIRTNYNYTTRSENPIAIGFNSSNTAFSSSFSGVMDEFILENKARTSSEIANYYNGIE